jgi:hypothetical protein
MGHAMAAQVEGVEVAGGTAKVAVTGVEIEIIKTFENGEGIGHFTAHVDLGFDETGVRIRTNGNQPWQLAAKGLRRAVREVFFASMRDTVEEKAGEWGLLPAPLTILRRFGGNTPCGGEVPARPSWLLCRLQCLGAFPA